jgi:hypothetical protein
MIYLQDSCKEVNISNSISQYIDGRLTMKRYWEILSTLLLFFVMGWQPVSFLLFQFGNKIQVYTTCSLALAAYLPLYVSHICH